MYVSKNRGAASAPRPPVSSNVRGDRPAFNLTDAKFGAMPSGKRRHARVPGAFPIPPRPVLSEAGAYAEAVDRLARKRASDAEWTDLQEAIEDDADGWDETAPPAVAERRRQQARSELTAWVLRHDLPKAFYGSKPKGNAPPASFAYVSQQAIARFQFAAPFGEIALPGFAVYLLNDGNLVTPSSVRLRAEEREAIRMTVSRHAESEAARRVSAECSISDVEAVWVIAVALVWRARVFACLLTLAALADRQRRVMQ